MQWFTAMEKGAITPIPTVAHQTEASDYGPTVGWCTKLCIITSLWSVPVVGFFDVQQQR